MARSSGSRPPSPSGRPLSQRHPLDDGVRSRVDFSEAGIPTYEQKLAGDPRWALSEGSRHFEEESAVFAALHKIARRLDDLKIPYVVVGGMALFRHGLRRFTEDVDILVTKEDLR